jgi:hypothetical protein
MVVRPTTDKGALLRGVDLISIDTGASRFVEGLMETAARFDKEREKVRSGSAGGVFPVVVIVGTTNRDGSQFVDRDMRLMIERYTRPASTVHVVMFNARMLPLGGGSAQTDIGLALSKMTQGRYEAIVSSSHLPNVLSEMGAQVARSNALQSQQHLVVFQRPAGQTGDVKRIGLTARPEWRVTLSPDGRIPKA